MQISSWGRGTIDGSKLPFMEKEGEVLVGLETSQLAKVRLCIILNIFSIISFF